MAEFDTLQPDDQLKLGQLTCDIFHGATTQTLGFYLRKQPAEFGRVPRAVYTWDCAKHPGGNPKPPAFVTIPLHFSNATLNPNGSISRTQQQASARRLAQHGRFRDAKALETALEHYAPPIAFRIDLSPFNALITKNTKVTIVGWPDYLDFFLRSKRQPNDVYLLSVPSGLTLQAVVTGFCDPPEQFPERLVYEAPVKDTDGTIVPTVTQTEEEKYKLFGVIMTMTFADAFKARQFDREQKIRDARQRNAYGTKWKAKP